jgi:hypothetical protein
VIGCGSTIRADMGRGCVEEHAAPHGRTIHSGHSRPTPPAVLVGHIRRVSKTEHSSLRRYKSGHLAWQTLITLPDARAGILLLSKDNAPLSLIDKDEFGKYQFFGRARIPMGLHRARLNVSPQQSRFDEPRPCVPTM